MAKTKREILREIYSFVEETYLKNGDPVLQKQVIDTFCDKHGGQYPLSRSTVTRYLDELVHSRKPFHLRTWTDKQSNQRYYRVLTVSMNAKALVFLFCVILPIGFYIDLFNTFPVLLTEKILLLSAGYIAYILFQKYMPEKDKAKPAFIQTYK